MKRNLILTVLALALTFTAVAQPKEKECKEFDKKELQAKIMKMKRATFTQNLKLTKEESERFWPIYEAYEKELNALMEKKHETMSSYKDVDLLNLDDEQAKSLLSMEIENEKMIANLKASYYEKFSEVLPVQKVVKLISEEKELMRNVMKKDRKERKPEEKPMKTPPAKHTKIQPKIVVE